MKKFNGYDAAKEAAQFVPGAKLPVGGYVCKIMGVRYTNGENGNSDMITLQFDIVEGEHKDFFKKKYEAENSEDKKWKGTVRIYCPKDDGTERDGWTKNNFARWTNAFEESNSGYAWDWDETKWKDKLIGIVFGETGTVIDGKEVTYTEPRSADSVQNIRDGKFYEQKFKAKNGWTGTQKNNATTSNAADFVSVPAGVEEEIPF